MRQFLSPRWWLTVAVLVGAALLVAVVVGPPGDESIASDPEPPARRMDLVQRVVAIDAEPGWVVRDGVTRNDAVLLMEDTRQLQLVDGTLGQDRCDQDDELGGCVLLADTLGDAIVWFVLLDTPEQGDELTLPPIVELLDGNTWSRLENGWEMPLEAVVERRCDTETLSIANFVDRFGTDATSVLDLGSREISAVVCEPG